MKLFHSLALSCRLKHAVTGLALVVAVLTQSGCATIVANATGGLASSLSAGILNQDDLETVRDGMPAYLLLVDGFIIENPENEGLLLAGAELYSAYSGAFNEDAERANRLATRGREYGQRALCLVDKTICNALDRPFDEFVATLSDLEKEDLPALYSFAASFATWISIQEGNWDAIAEVPKVEAAMQRIVDFDPNYRDGWPYVYLGVLNTQLPPAYGGKPERGREFFETAIAKSNGRNLMALVLFAERYGRLVFDQDLHDRLLTQALESDPTEPDLTLINVLAQRRAKTLLAQSSQYF